MRTQVAVMSAVAHKLVDKGCRTLFHTSFLEKKKKSLHSEEECALHYTMCGPNSLQTYGSVSSLLYSSLLGIQLLPCTQLKYVIKISKFYCDKDSKNMAVFNTRPYTTLNWCLKVESITSFLSFTHFLIKAGIQLWK